MERGRGGRSAVQELEQEFGIPVIAIATLDDLLGLLAGRQDLAQQRREVISYREQYGAAA
jgi:orotate phosphoribosyltransferase